MGNIAKRPNGKYRARYRDATGKEHARHFTRKGDAERWLAQQVVRLADGTWVDPQAGRRTFAAYVHEWLADQVQHRPGTADNTARRIHNHLLPAFGPQPLTAIRRGEIQAWVRTLSDQGLAPTYVEALYRLLAQILRSAVADRLLTASPCHDIRLPARTPSKVRIPTPEEIASIVGALPQAWGDVVLVTVGSGLRLGEALGLTVDRVNFLRPAITVDRQLHSAAAPWFGPPKTAASERTIPVAPEVVELIAQRLERTPARVHEIPVGPPGPQSTIEQARLVFTTDDGLPWRRHRWRNTWSYWVPGKLGLSVRFHDLRHLYASALIAAGQSAKVVQERLGHASISETFDTYGHLMESDEDGTRAVSGALVATVCGLVTDRTA